MPVTAMTIAILIGAAAGAAVFAGLFFILRASMRRQTQTVLPDITVNSIRIDDIWQTWRRGGLAPAAAFADQSPAQSLDENMLAGIRAGLLKTEKEILAQEQPLTALRREIMDGIDRRLLQLEVLALPAESREQLAEPIGDEFDIRRGLAADELRIRLLRYYGAAKFGDRAENDWYDVYQQAARMKQRSFRNFLRQRSGDSGTGQYRSAVVVGDRLRQRLLATPPGTSFPKNARQSAGSERTGL
ncbi:MAG TPA: hypothetical protein VFK45_09570 [Gammaproteobacteria bacterium]|nr:hypothetical protein [Gammaproteobacteria bacterium]